MIPEVLVGNTATTTLPSSSSSLLLHGDRNNPNTIITSCSTSTIPTNHHHHHHHNHSTFFQSSSDIFRFPSSISTFTPTITPTTTNRNIGAETSLNSITNNNQHTTASDPQQNLKCPRCDSTNTKFCYYNNYNLTQPRHFCKTCRRYWTKGGALRNVPIGGGCRKNKLSTGNNSINNTTSSTMGKHYSNSSYSNKAKVSFSGLSIGDINQSPTATTYGGGFLKSELTVPYNTQVFWSPPTTHAAGSHILSLLKSSSTQNPNPNTNHHHSNPFFTLNSDGVDTRISGGGDGNLSREVNGLDLGNGRRPSKIVGLGLDSNRVSNDCSTVCQLPSSFSLNGHHQSYNYFQKENRDSVKVHPIGGFEEMIKIRRNLNDGDQPAGMGSGNNTFSSSSSSVSKAAGTSTVVTSSSQINGGSGFGCFISSPLCWSDLCPTPSRNAAYP